MQIFFLSPFKNRHVCTVIKKEKTMNYLSFLPGIICISAALAIMFRLMHYAPFYAPSYFFWIGIILTLVGVISLIRPMAFLFIFNRTIAGYVIGGGLLISLLALCSPIILHYSNTQQHLDSLLKSYTFNEYHEVTIGASPEKIKETLKTTGVKDIPVVLLLMKIRGIADENKDMSDSATNNRPCTDTFTTPDFNFIVADSSELITLMILKASGKTPPPEITTFDEFRAFNQPGYVKVVVNFRFIPLGNNKTLLSTETRNLATTPRDNRIFGRYWRIIYPGSAIIRRVWLNDVAKKAEHQM
ncbi:MAG TPA: hypothetical protein PLB87_05650 [Prolixibacteraceae bacterium]|nr:hypothetical protein [Prolixibacteraceae bacterium]